MGSSPNNFSKRCGIMLLGNLLIGICVASYRLGGFGVDAFSSMILGISGFTNISFGTWQLIVNAVILIFTYFTVPSNIGLGTLVNMVGIGYLADFFCWLVLHPLHIEMSPPLRILAFLLGTLFASLGVALYMAADMGVSPYDGVAMILEKLTNKRISFRLGRVMSDVTVIMAGIIFCVMSEKSIWTIIGFGTLCNALFNGPLIQFFRFHVVEPLMKHNRKKKRSLCPKVMM